MAITVSVVAAARIQQQQLCDVDANSILVKLDAHEASKIYGVIRTSIVMGKVWIVKVETNETKKSKNRKKVAPHTKTPQDFIEIILVSNYNFDRYRSFSMCICYTLYWLEQTKWFARISILWLNMKFDKVVIGFRCVTLLSIHYNLLQQYRTCWYIVCVCVSVCTVCMT